MLSSSLLQGAGGASDQYIRHFNSTKRIFSWAVSVTTNPAGDQDEPTKNDSPSLFFRTLHPSLSPEQNRDFVVRGEPKTFNDDDNITSDGVNFVHLKEGRRVGER